MSVQQDLEQVLTNLNYERKTSAYLGMRLYDIKKILSNDNIPSEIKNQMISEIFDQVSKAYFDDESLAVDFVGEVDGVDELLSYDKYVMEEREKGRTR